MVHKWGRACDTRTQSSVYRGQAGREGREWQSRDLPPLARPTHPPASWPAACCNSGSLLISPVIIRSTLFSHDSGYSPVAIARVVPARKSIRTHSFDGRWTWLTLATVRCSHLISHTNRWLPWATRTGKLLTGMRHAQNNYGLVIFWSICASFCSQQQLQPSPPPPPPVVHLFTICMQTRTEHLISSCQAVAQGILHAHALQLRPLSLSPFWNVQFWHHIKP